MKRGAGSLCRCSQHQADDLCETQRRATFSDLVTVTHSFSPLLVSECARKQLRKQQVQTFAYEILLIVEPFYGLCSSSVHNDLMSLHAIDSVCVCV